MLITQKFGEKYTPKVVEVYKERKKRSYLSAVENSFSKIKTEKLYIVCNKIHTYNNLSDKKIVDKYGRTIKYEIRLYNGTYYVYKISVGKDGKLVRNYVNKSELTRVLAKLTNKLGA